MALLVRPGRARRHGGHICHASVGRPQHRVRVGALEGKRADAGGHAAGGQRCWLARRCPCIRLAIHECFYIRVDWSQVQDGQLQRPRQRHAGMGQAHHARRGLRVPNPRLARREHQRSCAAAGVEHRCDGAHLNGVTQSGTCRERDDTMGLFVSVQRGGMLPNIANLPAA